MTDTKLMPDKIYATFWWEIELDHSHPRNWNKKVTTLYGYSKFQGHDEARDKKQMCCKKVEMLATNGYLERTKWIIFYKRGGTLINKSQDKILFTLFKDRYEIPVDNLGKMPVITKYLSDFYELLRTGKDFKHLLPKAQNATWSKDEIFDITRHNFISQSHLYNFAEQKIKDGHSYLQVQNFVIKYLERKPFMTNEPLKKIA